MGEIATSAGPRIVFAGTSSFAVPILQSLVDAGYSISAVVTQPDKPSGRGQTLHPTPVKARALEMQLPVHQPTTLKSDDARRLFESLSPDLLVVVAYGKLLPAWLLALPRYGAVNLHASLLPRYRGAAPIQWAMANGEAETGVCTMRLDVGLDTGPVYACERTSIDPDESVQQLSERLAALGKGLMQRTLTGIFAETLQAAPQDHSQATLAPILTKQDGNIDWNWPARKIHNRIRAFQPWPGARTLFRNDVCRILKSSVREGETSAALPGSLVAGAGAQRYLAVVCGDGGCLEVLEVQLPNRKPQTGLDFVNGFRISTGEILHQVG